QEQFDLVWFMGVLYHLRHPLLALDIIRQRTRRMMVMQTLTMPGDEVAEVPGDFPLEERERLRGAGWPVMAFLEHRVARDPTQLVGAQPRLRRGDAAERGVPRARADCARDLPVRTRPGRGRDAADDRGRTARRGRVGPLRRG